MCTENTTVVINSDNYAAGATATAADYSVVAKRFASSEVLQEMRNLFEQSIQLSRRFDHFKKKVIYGKGAEELETRVLPTDLEAFNQAKEEKTLALIHCLIGIQSEVGEALLPLYANIFHGKPLDEVNVQEELGDTCWYIGHAIDFALTGKKTLTQLLQQNNDKLRARYPEKFTEFLALNRNLVVERQVLEHCPPPDEIKCESGKGKGKSSKPAKAEKPAEQPAETTPALTTDSD